MAYNIQKRHTRNLTIIKVNGKSVLSIEDNIDLSDEEIDSLAISLYPYLFVDLDANGNAEIYNRLSYGDEHDDSPDLLTNLENLKKYVKFIDIYNFVSTSIEHDSNGLCMERILGYNKEDRLLAKITIDLNKSCDEIFADVDKELEQKYPGYYFKRFFPQNDIKIALK